MFFLGYLDHLDGKPIIGSSKQSAHGSDIANIIAFGWELVLLILLLIEESVLLWLCWQ
jgi:hypothetical protein